MAKLAVVGSGPAAFYTVLRAVQKFPGLAVDMFEQHAFPYGLTRFGIAPDHPEVKNCQDRFNEVEDMTKFRFFGNCKVGRDVTLPELANTYDAVLLAYGASGERKLGIPGENSRGVLSARSFVGWYNGEPEFHNLDMEPLLVRSHTATIIGNGNVALDIARILLRKPDDLHATDISSRALAVLRKSKVCSVNIVGRRGLLQAAFTNKELRELSNEPGTSMVPVFPASEMDSKPVSRVDKRKMDLIKMIPIHQHGANKEWQLRFLRSPLEFKHTDEGLTGIEWTVNEHVGEGKVKATGEREFTPCELAFTSIGYRSAPLPGLEEIGVQFDSVTHTLKRERGKVGPNIFASGWIATGPVGVIASTMMDAFSVGDEIAKFLESEPKKSTEMPEFMGVTWKDWQQLDAEELARGQSNGKQREKFLTNDHAIDWLDVNR